LRSILVYSFCLTIALFSAFCLANNVRAESALIVNTKAEKKAHLEKMPTIVLGTTNAPETPLYLLIY